MRLFLLLLPMLLCSCIIPVHREVLVGEDLSGHVVDAATKKAISGAQVRYDAIPGYEVLSDVEGVFVLAPQVLKKTYWMPPAPVDPPPWWWAYSRYTLVINAPGYEEGRFERIKDRFLRRTAQVHTPEMTKQEYSTFELKAKL